METSITVGRGVDTYMDYHRSNSRPNSVLGYGYTLRSFKSTFFDVDITKVPVDQLVSFMERLTGGRKQATKATRAGHLSACFNFVAEAYDLDFRNPFSRGILKKMYKQPRHVPKQLHDREVVEQIVYRADGRDRLILELMAKGAMRISEVLGMRAQDLNVAAAWITLPNPKFGRQGEVVQLHQKLTQMIADYIREKDIASGDRVFPISYTTAHRMVVRRGRASGIKISPHDFRRHAATQASRAGVALELISKVILRHADIATTQRYLGEVSAAEGRHVMESLHG